MDIENKKEAARKKSLGELGELFAIKAFVDKKFDRIRNLNDNLMNESFADIECEKDGLKYIISVKARYNLGADVYGQALSAEKKYNASAYWMAIQFDHKSFSIFFGSIKELNGSKAIPVDKCEKGIIGEIWELNKRHYFDFEYYTNQGNKYVPKTNLI